MNGAGESAPSNNVSIPSLPDIAPVTVSLRHQVWKSDGEIMVSVSFKVSYNLWTPYIWYCDIQENYSQLCIVWNILC